MFFKQQTVNQSLTADRQGDRIEEEEQIDNSE
jgi:hypothetical protein